LPLSFLILRKGERDFFFFFFYQDATIRKKGERISTGDKNSQEEGEVYKSKKVSLCDNIF
jgi:hypothetical protein